MNEVSYDQLLGVEFNHPISCPIINPLKFCGLMSSKIYKVELEYDPEELKINIKELLDSIKSLDNWSTGLVRKAEDIPSDLKSKFKFQFQSNESIENIKELIYTDYKEDLIEKSSNINALIESWEEYRNDYKYTINKIFLKEKEIEETKKEILMLSLESSDKVPDRKELLEYYKEELEELLDKKSDINFQFERYVKEEFINETTDFSNFLEIVRERNDNLRTQVSSLRQDVITIGKEYFNLYQPIEYLNMVKPEKENEINVGVIFNDTETDYRTPKASYFNQLKRIYKRSGISFLEKEFMMDIYDKKPKNEIINELTKLLKNKGFKVIRYYLNEQDFLANKDSYIENGIKSKIKAKP